MSTLKELKRRLVSTPTMKSRRQFNQLVKSVGDKNIKLSAGVLYNFGCNVDVVSDTYRLSDLLERFFIKIRITGKYLICIVKFMPDYRTL